MRPSASDATSRVGTKEHKDLLLSIIGMSQTSKDKDQTATILQEALDKLGRLVRQRCYPLVQAREFASIIVDADPSHLQGDGSGDTILEECLSGQYGRYGPRMDGTAP